MKKLMMLVMLASAPLADANAIQTKPLVIKKPLLATIMKLPADSSNANEVEKLIGESSACIPHSTESWTCQWKGDLKSNGVVDTLNISFEAGMITNIIFVDKEGQFSAKLTSPY